MFVPIRRKIRPFQFGTGSYYVAQNEDDQSVPRAGFKRKFSSESKNSPHTISNKFLKSDAAPAPIGIPQEETNPSACVSTTQAPTINVWKIKDSESEDNNNLPQPVLHFRDDKDNLKAGAASNLNPDGTVKTWLQRKKQHDEETFYSRAKIDPYIPTDQPDKLFDMVHTDRYKIIEEYDPSLLERRQRMPWWYKNRENRITGSKLVNALGVFGIEGLQRAWYETYDPLNPKLQELINQETEIQKEMGKERMAFGTANEIHANATIIKHLGEAWNMTLYETPLSKIEAPEHFKQSVKDALKKLYNWEWNEERDYPIWIDCFADSPDGKAWLEDLKQWISIEDKTPLGNRDPVPYKSTKYYYLNQCSLHLHTLPLSHQPTSFCIFASWSPTTTKMWKVKYDPLLWKLTLPLLLQFRKSGLDKKCPEKLFDEKETQFIAYYMKNASMRCEFIGEFESYFSTEWEDQVRAQRAELFKEKTKLD